MQKKLRTFLDANVLIAAHHCKPPDKDLALKILQDRYREFISSPFLQLEVIPQALRKKNYSEVKFLREYFDRRVLFAMNDHKAILARAAEGIERCGLGPLDALHVGAAKLAKADEFITSEKPKPGKPLYRTKAVRVVYLRSTLPTQSKR